ncbi:MAG: pyridoxal 5'-phosphate synthase glutaminase subunit PdxT [Actinobacteria bacterium]|nr:pyridoxal 5'-phosphate synthase glutaminase subunit PdxT [Actinomycetota bacterium]
MSARPLIGVLALQGDVREHARALAANGADVREVRIPEDLLGVQGMVLPGGESTTMSKLLHFQGLFEPLQERLDSGLPVYGSCAGMILLASEILDGRVDQTSFSRIDMSVRRNAFGSQVDSFESDLDMPVCGDMPMPAVFIRAPWVERIGDGVTVLARISTAAGADRIVAVEQGPAMATSFHPELTADVRVHGHFMTIVRRHA